MPDTDDFDQDLDDDISDSLAGGNLPVSFLDDEDESLPVASGLNTALSTTTATAAIAFNDSDDGTAPVLEQDGLRLLSSLGPNDKPLMPLPLDTKADVVYDPKYQQKCVLCNSIWRTRAEHIYIEHLRKPQAVVNFFAKYFKARVSHECVKTHMERHINLTYIGMSGLANTTKRADEIAAWKFREKDLIIDGLLCEIDEVRGWDCSQNFERLTKRAAIFDRLAGRLNQMVKERDEAGTQAVNIFQILMDIHESLPHEECKQIIREKVKSIRSRLQDGQS